MDDRTRSLSVSLGGTTLRALALCALVVQGPSCLWASEEVDSTSQDAPGVWAWSADLHSIQVGIYHTPLWTNMAIVCARFANSDASGAIATRFYFPSPLKGRMELTDSSGNRLPKTRVGMQSEEPLEGRRLASFRRNTIYPLVLGGADARSIGRFDLGECFEIPSSGAYRLSVQVQLYEADGTGGVRPSDWWPAIALTLPLAGGTTNVLGIADGGQTARDTNPDLMVGTGYGGTVEWGGRVNGDSEIRRNPHRRGRWLALTSGIALLGLGATWLVARKRGRVGQGGGGS